MSKEHFISEFKNNYLVVDHIGSGAFGTVYKCKQIGFLSVTEEERTVAVKLIEFKANEQEKAVQEINLLRSLNHPNIIKIFKSWVEFPPPRYKYGDRAPLDKNTKGVIFIETELCDLGSLRDWFTQVWRKREHAKIALYQIASGVDYLHRKKIIHRDLKPENILQTLEHKSNCVINKLCDFGISTDIRTTMTSEKGTHGYAGPEVMRGWKYNQKADIYSLGVIFYEMLVLGDEKNEALDSILAEMRFSNIYELELGKCEHLIDDQEKSLIKRMVHSTADTRPQANEILETLLEDYPGIENMKISTSTVSADIPTPTSFSTKQQMLVKQNSVPITTINKSDADQADSNNSNNFQTLIEKWRQLSLNENPLPSSSNKTNRNAINRINEKDASNPVDEKDAINPVDEKGAINPVDENDASNPVDEKDAINPVDEKDVTTISIRKEITIEKKRRNYWEAKLMYFESTCKNERIIKTLYLVAFLHPIDISTAFVYQILENLSSFDEFFFDVLQELSMFQRMQVAEDDVLISLDTIFQEVIRNKLELKGQLLQILDEILSTVYNMLKADEVEWTDLIQVETLWEHAAKWKQMVVKHKQITELIACRYENAGRYSDGLKFCRGAIENLKSIIGMKNHITLKIMYWEGMFYKDLEEYDDSLRILLEVYEFQKSVLGEEDIDTLLTARGIGFVYYATNNMEETKKWTVNALQKAEKKYGEENETTLSLKYDLAHILQTEGKYLKAENILKEILPLFKNVFGRKHFKTMAVKHNIAFCKEELRDEALRMLDEVLELEGKRTSR